MSDSPKQEQHETATLLPKHLGGGPHGLGDPDDRSLRNVEREILIPQKMKEKANKEKCADLVAIFTECSKTQGLLMPFKCRKESHQMKECLSKWYHDKNFLEECKEEFLQERSEYRRTGVSKKQKRKESATF